MWTFLVANHQQALMWILEALCALSPRNLLSAAAAGPRSYRLSSTLAHPVTHCSGRAPSRCVSEAPPGSEGRSGQSPGGQRRWPSPQGAADRGDPHPQRGPHRLPGFRGEPLGRDESCDWLSRPPRGRPTNGEGPYMPCEASLRQVDSADGDGGVAGGSVRDNSLLFLFCVHGVSGQDTARHVPGVSGQRRAAQRRVHSRARWQRRL